MPELELKDFPAMRSGCLFHSAHFAREGEAAFSRSPGKAGCLCEWKDGTRIDDHVADSSRETSE